MFCKVASQAREGDDEEVHPSDDILVVPKEGHPALLLVPFARQIQIASDSVKGAVARLADVEAPKWADDEASLDELRARIRKTIEYAESIPAAKLDGSETREITVPAGPDRTFRFPGETFLKHFSLPNFFFHVTMTYALLRQAGVELGKMDYLGAP